MSGVELGLAIAGTLGTIDVCLKHGEIIIAKYKTFRDAENAIEEQTVAIEVAWLKISQQLAFLNRVWETLEEHYQELQGRILPILERKLEASVSQISRLEKRDSDHPGRLEKRRAAKYTFLLKESLNKAIKDLQEWQMNFDTTWYLILRTENGTIDSELTKRPATDKLSTARHVRDTLRETPQRPSSVFLPGEKLHSAQKIDIPYSTAKLITFTTSNTSQCILDSVDCSTKGDASTLAKNVRRLAAKLQQIEPNNFHLLKCHGVVRQREPISKETLSYDFIFHMPSGCSEPQSLRSCLLSQVESTLSNRLTLARQFAMAIHYVHVLDFVHKNIRPETVLIFQGKGSQLSQLYLLGFQAFRLADGKTQRLGGYTWSENIYQHPDRQGSQPDADYIMQHDIYSLGVCLLEIGLWKSLVSSDGQANPSLVSAHDAILTTDTAAKSSLHDHYFKLAREKLPFTMGEKYTEVVLNCLSSMEMTHEDFDEASMYDESEFKDEDGIVIGVNYIKKVILLLGEISF